MKLPNIKLSTIKKFIMEYMWIIVTITVFILGIVFIFWVGNTEVTSGVKESAKIQPEYIAPINDDSNLAMPDFIEKIQDIELLKIEESPGPAPSVEAPIENELDNDNANLCPTLLIKRGNKIMLFNKNIPEAQGENPIFFNNLSEYKEYIKLQRDLYNQNCPILFLQEEENAQGDNVYRLRKTEGTTTNIDPLMLSSVNDYFKNNTQTMPKFTPPQGPNAFNKPPPNNSIHLANYGVVMNEPNVNNMTSAQQPMVPYVDANRSNAPFNQGFYGFDPHNQYVGKRTVLDDIHDSTQTQNPTGLSDNPMDTNWGGATFTEEQINLGKYSDYEVQPPTVTDVLKYDDYPSAFDGNIQKIKPSEEI